jgi:hypothetical protein
VLKDGKYSVWFRTPLAEGTGVVLLAPNGRLSGGDTVLSYTGHWRIDGELFEAAVFTARHSPGQPSVFGVDDLDISLIGRAKGGLTASCKGTAKQAPGLSFEATLVRMADGESSTHRGETLADQKSWPWPDELEISRNDEGKNRRSRCHK